MKYIFVTGGVMSGLGKGITAASVGRILKNRGVGVTAVKIDPYLNIDAGTMNPAQHGEVYVLADGAEVDLDLGNYERFLDIDLSAQHNITTGKVYRSVIEKERRGDFLGDTVQIIPHITDEIKASIRRAAAGARRRGARRGGLPGRGRRHGRRHRVHAVSRGRPSDAGRAPARRDGPDPRHARARGHDGRHEDQAHAALGQGAPRGRALPRHDRVPVGPPALAAHEAEDLGLLRRAAGRRDQRAHGPGHLPGAGRAREGGARRRGHRAPAPAPARAQPRLVRHGRPRVHEPGDHRHRLEVRDRGRLPLDQGGPQARRAGDLDRGDDRLARRRAARVLPARRHRRRPRPRRVRKARDRGEDRRDRVRPGGRGALPRALPRVPARGRRVQPERARVVRCLLGGDRRRWAGT